MTVSRWSRGNQQGGSSNELRKRRGRQHNIHRHSYEHVTQLVTWYFRLYNEINTQNQFPCAEKYSATELVLKIFM